MSREGRSTVCLKSSSMKSQVNETCRCHADLAYLCTSCDAQIHAADKLSSRHKRVWMCEACEQAPAAFTCKADAASLCVTCDAVIHSANPLAQRHHRVPVMPVLGAKVESQGECLSRESVDKEGDDEAASWLLFKNSHQENSETNEFLFSGEGGVDEYLDLVEYNSCQDTQFSDDYQFYMNDVTNNSNNNQQQSYGSGDADSEVPVQYGEEKNHQHVYHFEKQKFQLGMEYETSNGGYGYPASFGHSVSMSSMELGVVPDSTTTEGSNSNARTPKGAIDPFSNSFIQLPTQLTPIDREARVLRYREKKKARKFEKTIRYASRKAYAETRPRIKGRFAKRTNIDAEMEQMFLMTEGGYCIVPSF